MTRPKVEKHYTEHCSGKDLGRPPRPALHGGGDVTELVATKMLAKHSNAQPCDIHAVQDALMQVGSQDLKLLLEVARDVYADEHTQEVILLDSVKVIPYDKLPKSNINPY